MIIAKTFWKIVKKYKFIIIMFSIIQIIFAGFNMKTSDNTIAFSAEKPDVLIINNDKNIGVTQNLIKYIEKHCNIVDINENEDAINDALFYRDVSYVIYIPENYREDFLSNKDPEIKVKSTNDASASLAETMLSQYMKVSNIYIGYVNDENELIEKINTTLDKEIDVEMTSKLDTDNLEKATFYYNFLTYSMLSICIYIVCMILASFKEKNILKRTTVSSTNYKKINKEILIQSGVLVTIIWIFFIILSFIFVGNIMFTFHGMVLMINSFIFMICATTIAFLLGNIVNNKDALMGIVNVIGLGSSFLCGAFVPVQFLPDFVLKIAHLLPAYWFIQTNEAVKTIEKINFDSLNQIFLNMGIIIIFAFIFIVFSNIVTKRKRVLN